MDRDQFERVQALFREALLDEPEDLDAFLDERCAGDPALRGQVETLLRAHREAEGFLEAGVEPRSADALIGRTVGSYRVVRQLGEGGMGLVFLAERADDAFRKRIAIKVLQPGHASEEIVRRFTTERQILAGLDHPNIANLIDGGTTDDGRPYIAMEYVEGKPIDVYCDDRGLSVKERLELFLVLCDAVQFAHGNLVVHRDLKPSNVLITATGELKLLDFGIAKLLNPELAGLDARSSVSMLRLLTPEYASPEQVQQQAVTTATDVYSLGVLLYELLTGRRPYRLRTASATEMMEAICLRTPEPPSVAVTREEPGREDAGDGSTLDGPPPRRPPGEVARLRRRLVGDLDTIVGKALSKKPEQRYPSVALLAEDLRRHLQGLPVRARRSTLGYRGAKFAVRYRWPLLATVVVLVALVGLGSWLAWETARAESALAAAEIERERSERLTEFLMTLFSVPNPRTDPGQTATADEMLQRGAEMVITELAEQPEVQARAGTQIGRILGELGEYDQASELLEGAVATLRGLGEDDLTAEALAVLGSIRIGQGELAEAESLLEEAREILERRVTRPDLDLAAVLHELGVVALHQERLGAAGARVEEALAMHRAVGGNEVDEAQMLNTLGAIRYREGKLTGAESLYRQALAIRLDALGPDHLVVSETRNNLAALLATRGEALEASELYRGALAIRRRVLGDLHPQVATTLHNLGGALRDLGDLPAAEAAFREAIAIFDGTVGRNHPYTAGSLLRLGAVLEEGRQVASAERSYRESLAIHQNTLGDPHPKTAETELYLARLLASEGELSEALERAGRAERILTETRGPDHWQTAAAATVRAMCLIGQGDVTAGRELLESNLQVLVSEADPLARGFREAASVLSASR